MKCIICCYIAMLGSLAGIFCMHVNMGQKTLPIESMASASPSFEKVLIQQPQESGPADENAEYFALIIGISDYPGTDNDLRYCDDDAYDVRAFIKSRYHVLDANIITLIDSAATKIAIQSAINTISSQMDANDVLLFSYSGHGSASLLAGSTISWSVQSSHPYGYNRDDYYHKYVAGATMLRVHFTEVYTESGYDYVFIGDYRYPQYYYDYFTGGPYYNVYSEWVETNDIYVNLYSDNIYNYWGFQTDYVQTASWTSPYEIIPYDGISSGLTGSTLDSWLDGVPGSVVALLDSCMSGGVGNDLNQAGRYVMTACQSTEYSVEDSVSNNGVFTNAFLSAWNSATDSNDDGAISFEEVYPIARSATITRSTQLSSVHHPTEFDGIASDVVLDLNAKIVTFTGNPSGGGYLDFFLNGQGRGILSNSFYDTVHHLFMHVNTNGSVESRFGMQTLTWPGSLPFTADVAIARLKAIFQTWSEVSTVKWPSTFTPPGGDSDGDSLSDNAEFMAGTNPWASDTDEDGINDAREVAVGLDPLVNDANLDPDGDGLPNWYEANNGLNPFVPNLGDTDRDGLKDTAEYVIGTNPNNPDTDGDGLDDGDEIDLGTNPLNIDTDHDGFKDGDEIDVGNDPLDPLNSPAYHFIMTGIIVALPCLVVIGAKNSKLDVKRAAPGPHPASLSKRTSPPPRPSYSPSYSSYNPIGSYGTTSYRPSPTPWSVSSPSSPQPSSISAPMTGSRNRPLQFSDIEPFLPVRVQLDLARLPYMQRLAVQDQLLAAFKQAMLRKLQADLAARPFCIRCGARRSPYMRSCPACGFDPASEVRLS